MEMALVKKSEYVLQLSVESRQRYEEKLKKVGLTIDPYCLENSAWEKNPEALPLLSFSDVMMFMVSTPSPYTKQCIKAWKGMLDSEGFVSAGWVHDLGLHSYTFESNLKYLVRAKVNHSQRISATPLLPWVVVQSDGTVLASHCTCMAGLGESCTHIAAVLTTVVQAVKARKETGMNSCTSQACYWLPTSIKVHSANISDINFQTSNKKRCATEVRSSEPAKRLKTSNIIPPSQNELTDFFRKISESKEKPAILKIVMPYANDFIPMLSDPKLPAPLTELYNPDLLQSNYLDLVSECEKVFSSLQINEEQIALVEKTTRGQSIKKSWFMFRSGRLTASVIRSVVKTSQAMPSPSLIKKICYPQLSRIATPATRWGCDHEKDAIEAYQSVAEREHNNLVVIDNGLFLDIEKPYIGASPDGLVRCSCCGDVLSLPKTNFQIVMRNLSA